MSEKPNIEAARTAFTPASPCKIHGQRISDLIFNFLRAASHPIGINDDLVFAQIRNRIHGRLIKRAHAKTGEQQRAANDEKAVSQRPFDDAIDHKIIVRLVSCASESINTFPVGDDFFAFVQTGEDFGEFIADAAKLQLRAARNGHRLCPHKPSRQVPREMMALRGMARTASVSATRCASA